MARRTIAYAGPNISVRDVVAVTRSAMFGFYENYRRDVQSLETTLKELTGRRFAIAVNSATAALQVSLAALDLSPGDEVITSDSSCVASAMPILHVGAEPVLVDVELETLCISPAAIKRALTEKTKAILPVHWNGHPADMDAILEIAAERAIPVIEDAAAALGSECRGKPVGSFGLASVFSFQGAKIAIGGQGGAIVTDDEVFADKIRTLASYGRTDSKMQYWSDFTGWNMGLGSLPAALANSQLKRLGSLKRKKRQIFVEYDLILGNLPDLRLVAEPNYGKSNYSYPIALINQDGAISRNEILTQLNSRGIDARPAQPRISQMPMFTERFRNAGSDLVEKTGIILPSAHRLTRQEVRRAARLLRDLL